MNRETRVVLWDAVNRYAQACGADTSNATVSGPRMDAVVEVDLAVERAERDALLPLGRKLIGARDKDDPYRIAHAVGPYPGGEALCGAKPGRRWVGWSHDTYSVTCPRCLRKARAAKADLALEPSAGHGAIAEALRAAGAVVTCVELDPKKAAHLRSLGFEVVEGDFAALAPSLGRFDVIAANPPFSRQADVDHVLLALDCLRPGGRLASVMSSSVRFRDNAKTVAFRARVEAMGGAFEDLPPLSFRESGTDVNTCVLTVTAPGRAVAPKPAQGQLEMFSAA